MTPKRHALIFVTITVFLDTVGFGIIMPVLPQFLMELSQVTLPEASAIAGYLVVAYAGLQFIFAPIIGNLSDRFGRRPVLLVSLGMYSVNYLIAGLATTLWVLFLGRFLTGITSATYATANALIADVSDPEERAQNFGLMGVAFGLGFIFGPSLGGFLGEIDIRLPFFASAGLAALNTMYGFFVLRETLAIKDRRAFQWKRANPIGMLLQLKKYPVLVGLVAVMFVHGIGHHVYPSNWNFYTIEKFNWAPWEIGISMGIVGLLTAFVQGYLIRIVIPKWGAPTCAFVGFLIGATSYIGIAFAPSSMSLYMWCVVSAFAGIAGPAIAGIMSNQVPQNEQGELQGINASVGSITAIIGPLLMTQSFSFFTSPDAPIYFPGVAFMLAAILALIAVIIFAISVRVLDLGNQPRPSQGWTRSMRRISSGSSFEVDIGYSRAVHDGAYLHISGTTGFNYQTMTINDDVVVQANQCLDNIAGVLAQENLTFAHVVRVNYIFSDRDDFQLCWPAFRDRFGDHPPAATMIVAGLADPRMKLEIEVTAKTPSD